MMLKDFEGNVSLVKGAICVELTICSKTLPTTFFAEKRHHMFALLSTIVRVHQSRAASIYQHHSLENLVLE